MAPEWFGYRSVVDNSHPTALPQEILAMRRTEKEARHRLPVGPRLKSVLKMAYRVRRPALLEGPTGIGKSEVVREVAEELQIGWAVLDLSLLEPPDLVGLPVIDNGRTKYASPEILPMAHNGILVLEELNRAERYIQQPALQLLTARRLHQYTLPEGWSVVAAINPEQDDYQVTPLDPALRCRFLQLYVYADRANWVAWAEKAQVHRAVLHLARNYDQFLEQVPPRSWAYVSQLLGAVPAAELENGVLMRDLLSGYLPPPIVDLLLRSIAQVGGDRALNVVQLLGTYHKAPQLRKQIQALREGGQTDRMHEIACQLRTIIEGPELNQLIGRGEFSLEAFEALLADLPGDHRERLQERVASNLLAARLLDVRPEDILGGGYAGSQFARRVDEWAKDRNQRYRMLLLAGAFPHHLENVADISRLRNTVGARIGLGRFLDQLGEQLGGRLRAVLDRYGIDPIDKRRS
jgi:hypothetical protein